MGHSKNICEPVGWGAPQSRQGLLEDIKNTFLQNCNAKIKGDFTIAPNSNFVRILVFGKIEEAYVVNEIGNHG